MASLRASAGRRGSDGAETWHSSVHAPAVLGPSAAHHSPCTHLDLAGCLQVEDAVKSLLSRVPQRQHAVVPQHQDLQCPHGMSAEWAWAGRVIPPLPQVSPHLAGGPKALLELHTIGFVLYLSTEVEVGDVSQEKSSTGDGQEPTAHGRHLGMEGEQGRGPRNTPKKHQQP